jgi:hypothetical protein
MNMRSLVGAAIVSIAAGQRFFGGLGYGGPGFGVQSTFGGVAFESVLPESESLSVTEWPLNLVSEAQEGMSFSQFPMGAVQVPFATENSFSYAPVDGEIAGIYGAGLYGGLYQPTPDPNPTRGGSAPVGSSAYVKSDDQKAAEAAHGHPLVLELNSFGKNWHAFQNKLMAGHTHSTSNGYVPDRDWTDVTDPSYRWHQYKASFDVQQGVAEHGTSLINREILNMDSWYPQLIADPLMNYNALATYGQHPPRYTTFPTDGGQSRPIVPCPRGTPDHLCQQQANTLGGLFFQTEQYNNPENFNALTESQIVNQPGSYAGFGAVRKFAPLGPQRIDTVGPAPPPYAASDSLKCGITLRLKVPYVPPQRDAGMLATAHDVSQFYSMQCACSEKNIAVYLQCRKRIRPSYSISTKESTIPPEMLPYPLGWYTPGFDPNKTPDPASYEPCGGFDDYVVGRPCRTVIIQGVTPYPALPPSGQIAQPGFSARGGPADPYKCSMNVIMIWLMDNPLAWNNHYDGKVLVTQNFILECLCDQFQNTIMSKCRAKLKDSYPIPTDTAQTIPDGPFTGNYPYSGLEVGLNQYPYTQGFGFPFNNNNNDNNA